ncbi:MAG: universal stress protein [Akkermansiaceae bacterium]|nr:universal stress protein [Akkermansiaceae bacterium]
MKTNIICATDFSAESSRASEAAAAFCAKTGETLILLHVCEPSRAGDESLTSSLHVAAKHRLHSEATRLRQSGTLVEELVLDGSPSSTLLSFLEETQARLLIVASQEKRSAPARWFSGGLIERLVKNSRIPTLVLRDPSSLEEWLSGGRPLKTFVAVGPNAIADIPLQWVKELAGIGPCEITATYLHWVPDEAIRLGLQSHSFIENSHHLQKLLENELKQKTGEILGDLPVTIHIEPRWGRADLSLIGIAGQTEADLIVVGSRLRHGLSRVFDESVSVDLLHTSPFNLAVVPLLESSVPRPLPVYDHILVPTDFSDAANHAILHACAIASPGATIHLLHVRDRFGVSLPEGTRQLQDLIPESAGERGVKIETIIEDGSVPAETILQVAARRMADIICMGSAGGNALSKVLLGSVASQVAASSPRPVLLVPKPL